jgi:FAD/FMN-containing dehydrogenase
MSSVTPALFATLRQSLSADGKVVFPSEADYDSMTQSWNKDFTARPSAVIWVACTADVVAAITFLRHHQLPFTVGCGLHSRYSLRDGHVLVNLGGMRKVTVDPTAKLVRLQGGTRNADLDAECAKYHLHTTAGTNPDTGCGGLVLGGGIGYLVRRFGLSIDQLVEVELVNAEGEVMRASEQQHADLFWACKAPASTSAS